MIQAPLQSPSLEFCLGAVLFSQEKGQVLGSCFVKTFWVQLKVVYNTAGLS